MSIMRTASRSLLPFCLACTLSLTPVFADGNDSPVAVTADGEKTLYSDSTSPSATASESLDATVSDTAATPASEPVPLPDPAIIYKGVENKVELSRDGGMCTWSLDTVKAEEVIEPIKAIFDKAISEDRIKIIENKAQNAIVARFINPTDGRIREEWVDIMKSMDRPLEQVMLEILIVELVVNDIGQWGANLRALAESVVGGDNISQLINVSHTTAPIETEALNNEGFKYFMNNGNKIKALLFSGTTKNKVRVLSSPQIIASNHRPATFKLGRTLPIITGTQISNGVTTYSYENKDIGINLNLTPHLSRSSSVGLDIHQEVNDLLSYDPDKKVADFAHKTLNSRVTLCDGQTVALGGYIQSSDRVNRKSVPGLSDMPLIGRYLNRDTKTQDKVEVIVFITPKVLKNPVESNAKLYQSNVFKKKEAFVDKMEKNFVAGTKFYGNSSLKAGTKKKPAAKPTPPAQKSQPKKSAATPAQAKPAPATPAPVAKPDPGTQNPTASKATGGSDPDTLQTLVDKIKKSHESPTTTTSDPSKASPAARQPPSDKAKVMTARVSPIANMR